MGFLKEEGEIPETVNFFTSFQERINYFYKIFYSTQ
jgi:hypothetical protein